MELFTKALECEELHAFLIIFLDHKLFLYSQGDCLGIMVRLTWIDPTTKELQSISLLVDIVFCDTALENQKSNEVTSEQLIKFLDRFNLKKCAEKFKFCGDFKCMGTIRKILESLSFFGKIYVFIYRSISELHIYRFDISPEKKDRILPVSQNFTIPRQFSSNGILNLTFLRYKFFFV